MEIKKLLSGFIVAVCCTQIYANDTIQTLNKESKSLAEKEKVLYKQIADPNTENLQNLRCVELPKLAEQRISINERMLKLAPKSYSEQIKDNNKLLKSKLLEIKEQFEC